MRLETIHNILLATGMPVAYYAFADTQKAKLPAIVYYCEDADNFPADNIAYYSATRISIELYTALKDTHAEHRLEDALTANNIYYTKTEQHLDDEKCFVIIYEIEV